MNPTLWRTLLSGALSIVLIGFLGSASYAQETEEPVAEEPVAEEEAPAPEAETPAAQDLLTVLQEHGGFTKLVGALEETGLSAQLEGMESYTLFAPTDEAFAAVEGTMSAEDLAAIIEFHAVPSSYTSETLTGATEVSSVSGDVIPVENAGTSVGGANIVEADIQTANGVVHAIDKVLKRPKSTL